MPHALKAWPVAGIPVRDSPSTLYHHLRQLVAAGWLHAAGRGHYSVPGGRVIPLLVLIAAVGPPPEG